MELSVVIPARNEEFLKRTVEDILKNKRAKTEVIAGLDGEWMDVPEFNKDVTLAYYHESIGQRAIANSCVKLSKAKYIMKVDAHCAFDEGFDVKMLEAFKKTGDNVVMAPVMRNLWVYDWKCYKCGKRVYQDRVNICPVDGEKMRKKMLWIAKTNPQSTAYYFSPKPKFGYFGRLRKEHKKSKDPIVESMSLQGSSFMCSRKKYWELNICDENYGSWGSQGIEVACKFWLSGGRVLVNRNTWYAHCFRTKSVFGFPYKLSGRQVQYAKRRARHFFFNKKWNQQVRPLSWLVEKFSPVPEWTDEELQKLKEREKASV
jgi:glycosyltransferase involved in cell wall biosynthesis